MIVASPINPTSVRDTVTAVSDGDLVLNKYPVLFRKFQLLLGEPSLSMHGV